MECVLYKCQFCDLINEDKNFITNHLQEHVTHAEQEKGNCYFLEKFLIFKG